MYGTIYPSCFSLTCSKNPPPAKKRPAAPKPAAPALPKVKAMFDYDATDTDELSFKENNIIEVIKEGGHQIEKIVCIYVVNIHGQGWGKLNVMGRHFNHICTRKCSLYCSNHTYCFFVFFCLFVCFARSFF